MERVVVNYSGKSLKRVVYRGKRYLVAPMTLIVPGVLNGSHGPLYYPADEVRASVSRWDGVPITLNHPSDPLDGSFVSASDAPAEVRLGMVRRPWVEPDGRLRAYGYFDEQRLKQLGLYQRFIEGEPIELSTGLFTRNEPAPPNAPYWAIARDYQPDHLALLPDSVGACSVKDGCGVFNSGPVLMGRTGTSNDHAHTITVDPDGYGWTNWEDGHMHQIADFKVRRAGDPSHVHSLNREKLVDTGMRTNAPTKTVGGKRLTADKFAYVPDPEKPSTWKLPIHDKAHVAAAVAALGKAKAIEAARYVSPETS